MAGEVIGVICIKNLIINPATFLSPMAGLTDSVFRRLIKRLGGCGLVMTEFTSAEGLTRNSLKGRRMLYYHEEERPITAQLFGADPQRLAEATRMVEDLGFEHDVDDDASHPGHSCGLVGAALPPYLRLRVRSSPAARHTPDRMAFGPQGAPTRIRSQWSESSSYERSPTKSR